MLICGMKLTHDGALAFIETDGDMATLIAAIETEKVNNHARREPLDSQAMIDGIFALAGISPTDVDRWVVDGWHGPQNTSYPPVVDGAYFEVAPYVQDDDITAPLHRYEFSAPFAYESYRHAEGHLASGFATCPAAKTGQPVGVLIWDGGMSPQVYVIDDSVVYLGTLFPTHSCIFEGFGANIPPFVPDPSWSEQRRFDFFVNSPGKMMAYAGLGESRPELVAAIKEAWPPVGDLYQTVRKVTETDGASLFASFQDAVGEILVDYLTHWRDRLPADVCLVGGSALNIKWNSAIRSSGLFSSVWVPPFPNDAGSAIGTACASLMSRSPRSTISWDVYSGPGATVGNARVPGWYSKPCSVDELALVLADENPVVVVHGRAELGPRALGHRSILASPRQYEMKQTLNRVKGREGYRPVAPMCLEDAAPLIFDPGTPDPYMLFDHEVRHEWAGRIPAVLHLDGTARLQTVAPGCFAYDVVSAFHRVTGVPVLCNTSANYAGCGFFADVESAMRWGKISHVWSENVLYYRG